jgi:hypothetical protein
VGEVDALAAAIEEISVFWAVDRCFIWNWVVTAARRASSAEPWVDPSVHACEYTPPTHALCLNCCTMHLAMYLSDAWESLNPISFIKEAKSQQGIETEQ